MPVSVGIGVGVVHVGARPAGLAGLLVVLGATSWYDSKDIA